MYGNTGGLAYTGAAGLMIGGVYVGLNWLILAAVLLIVVGIVLLRVKARGKARA